MKSKNKYTYTLMTLADVKRNDQVFVPNTSAEEAVEIWRFLAGHRKDFPKFKDGDNVVLGIDEDAWCTPRIYREAYCPLTMTCIIRSA